MNNPFQKNVKNLREEGSLFLLVDGDECLQIPSSIFEKVEFQPNFFYAAVSPKNSQID